MTLAEKISSCRKKAGLSQEELAQKLDVSRQAVSKWECGEAVPETAKLLSLARAFGVTVDWLLAEEEDSLGQEPEAMNTTVEHTWTPENTEQSASQPDWTEKLPGFLRRMFLRWGWLSGVYVAAVGAGFLGLGALAKYLCTAMVSSFNSVSSTFSNNFGWFGGGEIQILDEAGNPVTGEEAEMIREAIGGSGNFGSSFTDPFGEFMDSADAVLVNNPASIMATVLMVLGALLLVAGIVLAVLLWKWGRKNGAR